MVPPRSCLLALGLLFFGRFAIGQTVINSTFLNRPQWPAVYNDPNNWLPNGVPNDTADRHYNVTIDIPGRVTLDSNGPDATISNLTLGSSLFNLALEGRSLTVTGTTTNQMDGESFISVFSYDDGPAVKFDAGTLSTFSSNVLSGKYEITGLSKPATLQFKGAN